MQEFFRIEGFAGQATLEGSIPVAGAKNAIIKGMAASILYKGPLAFSNTSDIKDIETFADMLRELGAEVHRESDSLVLKTEGVTKSAIPKETMAKLRASIVLTGPLLARFGSVTFSHPGGDVIGARPIDLFLEVFTKMGAKVSKEGSEYHAQTDGRLKGAELFFRLQSVTGTETAMLAGVLADGTTTIKNAAVEPEIVWLADVLNASGAHIQGAGTSTIVIEGREELLEAPSTPFVVIPDRIEAGSFAILGALAAKELLIENCEPKHLESLWEMLTYMGADVDIEKTRVRVRANKNLRGMSVRTHEYPGFPTDLQAPMTTLLTQASGESTMFETIFEGRLNFTEQLNAMGAKIVLMDPHRALIHGPTPLRAKNVESPDIRAGLAFIIAAAIADGTSEIRNIYHIDRGYGHMHERLQAIGMKIERVTTD